MYCIDKILLQFKRQVLVKISFAQYIIASKVVCSANKFKYDVISKYALCSDSFQLVLPERRFNYVSILSLKKHTYLVFL